MLEWKGFLEAISLAEERVPGFDRYPFSIPAIRTLGRMVLHPKVTFLIGENGSGKSTLIEAIAVACGFNPEGGTQNFNFSTRRSESELCRCLRVSRGLSRPATGFFLRAESYFNFATEIERLDADPRGPKIINSYGGRSLHEQSHGESFMALVRNRFGDDGLYILDEPEAALSPQRQLALLVAIDELVQKRGCQFVIATHSPIVLGYPDACIYELNGEGRRTTEYEDTEHFRITRDFLMNRRRYLGYLFEEE